MLRHLARWTFELRKERHESRDCEEHYLFEVFQFIGLSSCSFVLFFQLSDFAFKQNPLLWQSSKLLILSIGFVGHEPVEAVYRTFDLLLWWFIQSCIGVWNVRKQEAQLVMKIETSVGTFVLRWGDVGVLWCFSTLQAISAEMYFK